MIIIVVGPLSLPPIPAWVGVAATVLLLLLGLAFLVAVARVGARAQEKGGQGQVDASWFREHRTNNQEGER